MIWRALPILGTVLALVPATAQTPPGDDLSAQQEKAIKAAVHKVAPCVVQIETTGGTDLIGSGPQGPMIRKGVGPTTGLVVTGDGYVISSAFNFANKPTAIFVAVPGHKDRYVAKVVATDQTRMLTLLKIEAAGLPVPVAAPKKEFQVGQWALALGRTWSNADSPPSVSVGIISALGRIWGKAIQTDAKVSPVNYGGPLVDIQGRVQGVLVPASPRGENETAGVEWYDSGIGFAIPLEDVNAVLPRLKQGQDLKRGLLGIILKSSDIYGAQPVVASVAPESTAAKAGLKPGDAIVEIDGVKIARQAQMMHVLGNKYDGDTVSVKVKRGTEEVNFPNLKLAGLLTALANPFLGILPVRDDPELGVEIRYVYPKSPAEAAGLKAGDRILTVGQGKGKLQAFSGRDEFMALLNSLAPGTEVKLEVRRAGADQVSTVTAQLTTLPDTVPAELPEPATLKKALEPRKTAGKKPPTPPKKEEAKKEPEKGFLKRTNAAGDREYWVYVPENYDPNIAHALVVWLHPPRKGGEKDAKALVKLWEDACNDRHIILVGPRAENETGWLVNEAEFVQETVKQVMGQYTIDRQRVVAHGQASGGQMAFYLGLHARDLFRGVATSGAVLASQVKDNEANQRLSFFIVTGGKDPLVKAIGESKTKLVDKKFPVVFREVPDRGQEYLGDEPKVLQELVRWIDSLDRE